MLTKVEIGKKYFHYKDKTKFYEVLELLAFMKSYILRQVARPARRVLIIQLQPANIADHVWRQKYERKGNSKE